MKGNAPKQTDRRNRGGPFALGAGLRVVRRAFPQRLFSPAHRIYLSTMRSGGISSSTTKA